MTCSKASAFAAAAAAFFVAFVDARAADAVKLQNDTPTALSLEHFSYGARAGIFVPPRESSESSRPRGTSEFAVAPLTTRYQGGLEQPARVTRIAVVTAQPALATPERIGKLSATAVGPLARPGSGSPGMSLDGSGPANEESAPGPYAMLLIGISLAAFMAIRRMGHV